MQMKIKIKKVYRFYLKNFRYANFFMVCLFCALSVAFFDKRIAFYFRSQPELETLFAKITVVAKVYIWIALSGGACLFCTMMAGLSLSPDNYEKYTNYARSFMFMLVSIFSSALVIGVLKSAIGRARPLLLFSANIYGISPFTIDNAYMSFPSGHAQSICAAMTALFFIYPRYDFLYVLIAMLLTFSRIVTSNHYLSDIVMGAYIAVITTIAVKNYFEKDGHSVRIYLKRDKKLVADGGNAQADKK